MGAARRGATGAAGASAIRTPTASATSGPSEDARRAFPVLFPTGDQLLPLIGCDKVLNLLVCLLTDLLHLLSLLLG
jgi:hypothetical protein